MKRPPSERPSWPTVKAIIDAARAAGTHGDVVRRVCASCGEWCAGYWWVDPQNGKRGLGKCCAPPDLRQRK